MSQICHIASLVLSPPFMGFPPSFPLLSTQTKPSLSKLQVPNDRLWGWEQDCLSQNLQSGFVYLNYAQPNFVIGLSTHEVGRVLCNYWTYAGSWYYQCKHAYPNANYDIYKPRWFPPPLLLLYSSTMQAVEIHIHTSRCDRCKSVCSGVNVGTTYKTTCVAFHWCP